MKNHHRGTARRAATKGVHRRDAEAPRENGRLHHGGTEIRRKNQDTSKGKYEGAEVAETTEKYTERKPVAARKETKN
jgi:hypothetical protein